MAGNALKPILMTSFNSASLSSTYQVINTGGLPQACNFLRIVNGGSTAITISFDGVNPADYILNAQYLNLPAFSSGGEIAKKTQIWIKGTAGTGTITLSGYWTAL